MNGQELRDIIAWLQTERAKYRPGSPAFRYLTSEIAHHQHELREMTKHE